MNRIFISIMLITIVTFCTPSVYASTSVTYLNAIIDDASTFLTGPRTTRIQGDYLYVMAATDAALTIFDVSDPSVPVKVGELRDTLNFSNARLMEVSGDYVYIASNGNNRFYSIDISNKATPVIADFVTVNVWDFVIQGSYAYLTANSTNFCFSVVDISEPTDLQLVNQVTDPTRCLGTLGITVEGNYLYTYSTSGSDEYFTIHDISNPLATNTLVGSWRAQDFGWANANAQDIQAVGNYVYLMGWMLDVLLVMDVSNPSAPVLVESLQDSVNLDSGLYIEKVGDYLVIGATNSNLLNIISINDPTNVSIVNTVSDPTNLSAPYDLTYANGVIYVPSIGLNRVVMYSFDPVEPQLTGTPSLQNITQNTVTITWQTDEQASSQIEYGTSPAYGSTTAEINTSPRVTAHSVELTGLISCTVYHYRLISEDAAGNVFSSNDYTFTTACPPGVSPVPGLVRKYIPQPRYVEPQPEIWPYKGTVIDRMNLLITVEEQSLSYDGYMSIDEYATTVPVKIKGYTQITPVYDIWMRSFFNKAKVLAPLRPSLLTIKFLPEQLKLYDGREAAYSSLRIAYSPDEGKTWRLIEESIVSSDGKSISAGVLIGGYYTLVGIPQ